MGNFFAYYIQQPWFLQNKDSMTSSDKLLYTKNKIIAEYVMSYCKNHGCIYRNNLIEYFVYNLEEFPRK